MPSTHTSTQSAGSELRFTSKCLVKNGSHRPTIHRLHPRPLEDQRGFRYTMDRQRSTEGEYICPPQV